MHFVLEAIVTGLLAWPTANAEQVVDCRQYRFYTGPIVTRGVTRYRIGRNGCVGSQNGHYWHYEYIPKGPYNSARRQVVFFDCAGGNRFWNVDDDGGLTCL